jgi:uncharacterized protein
LGLILTITSRQDDGDFAFKPSVSQIKPGLSTPGWAGSRPRRLRRIWKAALARSGRTRPGNDNSQRPTKVKLTHSDVLIVKNSPGKGRGVFARKDIKKGTTIETVPIIVFDNDECQGSKMATYVFEWTKKTSAIALGYGSIYNHSFEPNARYYDGSNETKDFVAIRDIKAGEEITVNYNGHPKRKDKVDFNVIENANGHVTNGTNGSNGHAVNGNGKHKAKRTVPAKATASRKSRAVKK